MWGDVIWNDEGRQELGTEVERVIQKIRKITPPWWGWVLLMFPPLAVLSAGLCFIRGWWARRKYNGRKTSERAKL